LRDEAPARYGLCFDPMGTWFGHGDFRPYLPTLRQRAQTIAERLAEKQFFARRKAAVKRDGMQVANHYSAWRRSPEGEAWVAKKIQQLKTKLPLRLTKAMLAGGTALRFVPKPVPAEVPKPVKGKHSGTQTGRVTSRRSNVEERKKK
jgi:hypothetical protein